MSKTFLATKEQVDTVVTQITEINNKMALANLNSIEIGIVDFVNDDIVITTGGLDEYQRRITT